MDELLTFFANVFPLVAALAMFVYGVSLGRASTGKGNASMSALGLICMASTAPMVVYLSYQGADLAARALGSACLMMLVVDATLQNLLTPWLEKNS